MADIAIIVPTLRRPQGLERALKSLFAQTSVGDRLGGVVIVDNDAQPTAQAVVTRLGIESPWPLTYVHAPQPGVATARNAGLAATDAPLIAFLDDDEIASPTWLAELLKTHEALGADVTFGPIQGRAPGAPDHLRDYLEGFFSRHGPESDQLIDIPYGCGATLMRRATALPGSAPFDTAMDHTGGEDDVLFADIQARGGRFGWAADAWVEEVAPPHRARLTYVFRRAFAFGQGPCQTAARQRDWVAVARWMIIGAGQAVVFSLTAAALSMARHPRRFAYAERAVSGLGKLLWMGFEPHLYGRNEVSRLSAQSA